MSNPRQESQSGLETLAMEIKGSTTDLLKSMAVDLLRKLAADATIKKNDPVVIDYILLDMQAAKLNTRLDSHNEVAPLRDTANAGLAKLSTITQQPQAKQLAVVYREQFNGLDQEATKVIQGRFDMIKQLRDLIEAQQARIVNILKRTRNNRDPNDQVTRRELNTLSQDLKGITTKINEFMSQQFRTQGELTKLAKLILSAIPASERNAANLPSPDQVIKPN